MRRRSTPRHVCSPLCAVCAVVACRTGLLACCRANAWHYWDNRSAHGPDSRSKRRLPWPMSTAAAGAGAFHLLVCGSSDFPGWYRQNGYPQTIQHDDTMDILYTSHPLSYSRPPASDNRWGTRRLQCQESVEVVARCVASVASGDSGGWEFDFCRFAFHPLLSFRVRWIL